VSNAECWSDALRLLGYQPKGHNYRTLKRYIKMWGVSTDHFDPNIARSRAAKSRKTPLEEVLVKNSSYERGSLKRRLLSAGLMKPRCELCGQGEIWHGRRMALILDHVNGVSNDHRLMNLRLVCPNCAATLDTHCGRNVPQESECASCGRSFVPRRLQHRYCSMDCWGNVASKLYKGTERPDQRKVPRPSYDRLMEDLRSMSYCAVGRKYGVSDNAIRKWVRWYEAARPAWSEGEGGDEPMADAA
jgi:hypothetical protein